LTQSSLRDNDFSINFQTCRNTLVFAAFLLSSLQQETLLFRP